MNKRVIAAVGAAVLAALGVVILIVWAQGATERAYEGAELVSVVRVTETVPAGTKASELAVSTEVAELPADAIPEGAVTDLAEVQGLSTLAELQPGEVLVEARMGTAGDREEGKPDVPPGLQEVSVFLDNQRTIAGSVKPGDRVAVLGSYEAVGDTPTKITDVLLHDVLVTRVAGAVAEDAAVTGLTVTLAVNTVDAERIVFSQEWGKIWLTLQNADTDKTGERVIQDLGVLE